MTVREIQRPSATLKRYMNDLQNITDYRGRVIGSRNSFNSSRQAAHC
jgi:hypothetical protein